MSLVFSSRTVSHASSRSLVPGRRRPVTVRSAATKTAPGRLTAKPTKPAYTPSDLIKVVIPDVAGDDITKDVTADICYPQDSNGAPAEPKGVVVFMHGFSQMPISYDTTIQELATQGFFIIAPYGGRQAAFGEASVFSPKVQQLARSRATKSGFSWNPFQWLANLRYATQLALQQDGLQCVTYVTTDTKAVKVKLPRGKVVTLSDYVPKPFKKIGLCGHSMGGGLCFSVAAERPAVSCIGVMAPMPDLEKPFAPVPIISDPRSTFTNKTSRLLSGAWDFIVPASKVETIEGAIEGAASRGNKVTYQKLPRYFHTSFEDELTLGDVPLTLGLAGALVVLNLLVDSQLADGSWVEGALQIASGVVFAALVWLVILRPRFQQSVARDQMRDFFNENL